MKLKRLFAVSVSLVMAGSLLFTLAACKDDTPGGDYDPTSGLEFTANYVGHPTYQDGATDFEGFGVVEDDDVASLSLVCPLADEDDEDDFQEYPGSSDDDDEDEETLVIESYYVSSVGTNKDRELTIPSTYNGYPVVAIGVEAFDGHPYLRTLHIPSSIKRIARSAFRHCENLKTIDFEEGLEYLGTFVFSYCYELENVSLPDSLRIIQDGVFMYCTRLEEIVIPEHVELMSADIFANCTDLKVVNIPFSVKKLNVETFYGCTSLKEITIHSDISSIPARLFMACTKLREIYFEGTKAEWERMADSAGEYWDYNTRSKKRSYDVICSDGTIPY